MLFRSINGKIINLHQYKLEKLFGPNNIKERFRQFIENKLKSRDKMKKNGELTHNHLSELSLEIYESGYSCLDLINYIEDFDMDIEKKSNILMCFHKIKSEFRCEKLLIFYILDFMYLQENINIKNISFL